MTFTYVVQNVIHYKYDVCTQNIWQLLKTWWIYRDEYYKEERGGLTSAIIFIISKTWAQAPID
jgi:hypothetical protein